MTSRHSSFGGDTSDPPHGIWNTPTQSPHQRRAATFESIWSTFNPMSPPMSHASANFDHTPDFRRHSLGELYPSEESFTLDLVNDYFVKDPHRRVRVTLDYVSDKFFSDETYQLPKFPVENSLRNYQLVLVGFKAGRIDVFYLPGTPELQHLKLGDLVIVEADRGRDLGKIFKMNVSIDEARLLKLLQYKEQQNALHENDDNANMPTLHFPKAIISLATKMDIFQILNKKQDEEKACRLCLAKMANTTALANSSDLLQMKLIDAEYQFDRKKLIFYYSTSKRIDFRELVRELFRIYKTRIWMCAVVGLPYVPTSAQQNYKKAEKHEKLHQQLQPLSQPQVSQINQALDTPQFGQALSPNFGQLYTAGAPKFVYSSGPVPATSAVPPNLQLPQSYFHQGMGGGNVAPAAANWQAPHTTIDRRFSYPTDLGVPRNYQANEETDQSESFVLKSLVDQINH